MRLYSFCNMYLSSIQQGIQTQHSTVELFIKYRHEGSLQHTALHNWAHSHKTTIVLNGGYQSNLESLIELFDRNSSIYPWAEFREEHDSLNGALTSVCIVLPEAVYSGVAQYRAARRKDEFIENLKEWGFFTVQDNDGQSRRIPVEPYDVELIVEISRYSLAS